MNEVWCVIPRSWTDWLMGFVQLWFVKNYVRHHLMIMHALSLFRDTPHLPSRWLLCAKQTCWYKQVDFQLLNTHPFKIFWLKTSNWHCNNSFFSVPVGSCKSIWYGTYYRTVVREGRTLASFTDVIRTWPTLPTHINFVLLFYTVHEPQIELGQFKFLQSHTHTQCSKCDAQLKDASVTNRHAVNHQAFTDAWFLNTKALWRLLELF